MQVLTQDTFLVDNSLIEQITTCPWLAYASAILRKRPSEESSALRLGGFIHQAIAHRFHKTALGESWTEQEQIALLEKLFTENPLENEGYRNLDTAIKVIRGYNAQYRPEDETFKVDKTPDGKPYVELSFAVDTKRVVRNRRVIYIGRLDRKIVQPDGSKFIVDTKTTSKLGDTFWQEQASTEQHPGYCWADRECTGEEPVGYIVDAIGIRESMANAVFNDITGQVQPPPKSKAVPLELIQQPFFTRVPPGRLEEWFENMLEHVDNFLYCVDKDKFARNHRHCVNKYGVCQFYGVCILPEEQQRQDALASTAYKENEWTPLYV